MTVRSQLNERENGTAAIEFGLMAPLLLILMTGVVEIGMAMFQDMQVQAAAEAGALYAVNHGTGSLAAIELAVANATGTAGISASPIPLVYCGCPDSGVVVSQGSNCTTVCPDSSLPGHYVTVSATLARSSLIPIPYISLVLPASFTGTSVVRIN